MTTVTVRLFARARDLAGADTVSVELQYGATVADVRRRVAETVPALSDLLPRCAVAVNDEYATDNARVPADAELALLPPVSGG